MQNQPKTHKRGSFCFRKNMVIIMKLKYTAIAVMLAAVMIILCACGSNTANNNDATKTGGNKSAGLSGECDKVLCTGKDSSGNFYELVANEEKQGDDIFVEVGVIKNNEWSVPLTDESPFVGYNGALSLYDEDYAETDGSIYDEEYAKFYYVGNGCFYYNNTLLNGDNGKGYIGKDEEYNIVVQYGDKFICNDDGKFLLYKPEDKYMLLDAKTMKTQTVNLIQDSWDIQYAFPYSEGLFACMNRTFDRHTNGFYNEKGEKVIDLSKYNLTNNTFSFDGKMDTVNQALIFEDGKCTFKITDDKGVDYNITIDKSSKELKREKVS